MSLFEAMLRSSCGDHSVFTSPALHVYRGMVSAKRTVPGDLRGQCSLRAADSCGPLARPRRVVARDLQYGLTCLGRQRVLGGIGICEGEKGAGDGSRAVRGRARDDSTMLTKGAVMATRIVGLGEVYDARPSVGGGRRYSWGTLQRRSAGGFAGQDCWQDEARSRGRVMWPSVR